MLTRILVYSTDEATKRKEYGVWLPRIEDEGGVSEGCAIGKQHVKWCMESKMNIGAGS